TLQPAAVAVLLLRPGETTCRIPNHPCLNTSPPIVLTPVNSQELCPAPAPGLALAAPTSCLDHTRIIHLRASPRFPYSPAIYSTQTTYDTRRNSSRSARV